MANKTTMFPSLYPSLPHERLHAYQAACDLLVAIVQAAIRDSGLRDQALRAARSACLNIAEANGRVSVADRKRVFAIARGEASEAVAAMHVAALSGLCAAESTERVRQHGARAVALLTGLIR